MGGERQGPKGGRYVGSFLQLFDWNAKSRKKLFPTRSDLPEHPKQGKQSEGNFPTTRIRTVDEDEIAVAVSIKGSDYSCASSVTDEEGYGTKAPGVVARLMGLDCLPTSNVSEPYSSPFTDTQSLRETPFMRDDLHFSYQEHPIVRSGNFLDIEDGLSRNIVERKHQKSLSRPIEKFQTEMLPPRSAKSIPITHHKLLSPIKKPGFVPSKDAARIMEAAAKIIEPGPQASPRAKISSTGSTSVPLRVRELKDKMEASQRLPRFSEMSPRTLESNAAKSLKGKSMNKSWNGSIGTSFKASGSSSSTIDDSSASTKNKGKSISLAVQAKVNVQRREGMSTSQKNPEGIKEDDAFKQSQSSKSESSNHKIVHKKSSVRNASTVLKQNNHKQNCSLAKENLNSKPLGTNNLHGRRVVSGESSHGRQKSLYKDAGSFRVGSKKSSLEGRDGNKDISNSGARNVSRKKRSIDGNLQNERNDSADTMLVGKNEKLSKSNSVADRHFQGTDVVSFTFTTPMTRSLGGLELSKQTDDESNYRNKKAMLCPDSLKLSSPGYDVGLDSLSVLLEQKLRELTNGIDSSRCNFIKAEESSSTARQNAMNFCDGSEAGRFNGKNAPLEMQMGVDNDHSRMFSSFSSTEPEVSRRRYDLKGGEMDECRHETRQSDNFRLPSPVSNLDPSAFTESSNSSDSTGSNMAEECKQQCSSGQEEQMFDSSYRGTIHQLETEKDLSDSASSFSSGTAGISKNSADWELDYIKDILCNAEMMFNECAHGKTRTIINPHFFDHLERNRGGLNSCRDDLLERKALFDCVSECLEWRCQMYVGGGSKAWAKGMAMVTNKDRLAEDVYKEIRVWKSMRNNMVDELVDKDMSVQQGRWLDFEADEFELAVDIEDQLLDCLVDDIVADILPFSWWSSNAAIFC